MDFTSQVMDFITSMVQYSESKFNDRMGFMEHKLILKGEKSWVHFEYF